MRVQAVNNFNYKIIQNKQTIPKKISFGEEDWAGGFPYFKVTDEPLGVSISKLSNTEKNIIHSINSYNNDKISFDINNEISQHSVKIVDGKTQNSSVHYRIANTNKKKEYLLNHMSDNTFCVVVSGNLKDSNIFKRLLSKSQPVRVIYTFDKENKTYYKSILTKEFEPAESTEVIQLKHKKSFKDAVSGELKDFSELTSHNYLLSEI